MTAHPRPTKSGQIELEAAVGGPFAQRREQTFPLPIPSGGIRYGVSDRFDVQAHAHLAPIVDSGFGADVGSTVLVLRQHEALPAISATVRALVFTDFARTVRPFAETGVHASWAWSNRWLTYLTATAFTEFGGQQDHVRYFGAGQALELGALSLQLELRAYQPTFVNETTQLSFPRVLGAPFGVLLGASYAFGGSPR